MDSQLRDEASPVKETVVFMEKKLQSPARLYEKVLVRRLGHDFKEVHAADLRARVAYSLYVEAVLQHLNLPLDSRIPVQGRVRYYEGGLHSDRLLKFNGSTKRL